MGLLGGSRLDGLLRTRSQVQIRLVEISPDVLRCRPPPFAVCLSHANVERIHFDWSPHGSSRESNV